MNCSAKLLEMATNNMHNLTTLIKRLEAATARLEDIASSTIDLPQGAASSPPPSEQSALEISKTASQTPNAAAAPAEPLPESIEDFDAFINTTVQQYVKLSNQIGGLLADQAAQVFQGFQAEREFLLLTTKAKKPDLNSSEMSIYQDLLKPINEALMAVTNIKEANRGSPVFSQLSAVSEGIMVLAWVTVDNRPWKHVEESLGSAQFFGNRVLKEQKDKDPQQAEWVAAFYQVFRDLADYVKQYFSNGIPWNLKGKPAQEVLKARTTVPSTNVPSPSPPAGGVPPPPPPPPPGPPPVLDIKEESVAPNKEKGGLDAVFSELNKGDAVTKGLRKVDNSEMTHKNPSLRASSTTSNKEAARGKSPAPGKKPKPESMRLKKPAKQELDGNKWIIENFEKVQEPIQIDASISHSVLISRCNNATVIIKGKANAVTIENSNRLSLIVDSLVSTVDVVKSQNFALQVMGAVPTVMMDQIDGAQIYFSKESATTKIYSSKSSSINLNIIDGPDDDYTEIPLPYQICSYYDPAKKDLVNEIVSHAG